MKINVHTFLLRLNICKFKTLVKNVKDSLYLFPDIGTLLNLDCDLAILHLHLIQTITFDAGHKVKEGPSKVRVYQNKKSKDIPYSALI